MAKKNIKVDEIIEMIEIFSNLGDVEKRYLLTYSRCALDIQELYKSSGMISA